LTGRFAVSVRSSWFLLVCCVFQVCGSTAAAYMNVTHADLTFTPIK
jgi:hypothetical protein